MAKSVTLLGMDTMDALFADLASDKTTRKVARAGLTKGARLAVKRIKQGIPSRLKSVRFAMGHSVKTQKNGVTTAKAGAAVGKVSKAQGKRIASRKGISGLNKYGDGISANNVHWYILGTDARFTGQKTRFTQPRSTTIGGKTLKPKRIKKVTLTGGRVSSRGRMPAHPVVKTAASAHFLEIRAAVQLGISDSLAAATKRMQKRR